VAFLVLQHIACEPPGVYEDVLVDRGIELERILLDEGDALPAWRGFDAIIAMGGPMSVNDEAELPWLAGEKRLIADAVRAGTPYCASASASSCSHPASARASTGATSPRSASSPWR